jgi:hypothetical protein
MKRLAIGLGILSLAACTTKNTYVTDSLPELPATEVPTTQPAPLVSTLSRFSDDEIAALVLLDQIYDEPIYVDDEEIILTMNMTCDALRSGMSIVELSDVMSSAAEYDVSTMDFLAAIAGAAVNTICTDQAWKFGI